MKTRKELKVSARKLMEGNFGKLFIVIFLPAILIFLELLITSTTIYGISDDGMSEMMAILLLLVELVAVLAFTLVGIGIMLTLFDFSRTGDARFLTLKNVFRYFSRKGWAPFKIQFLINLFINLWALIPFVGWIMTPIKAYAYELSLFLYSEDGDQALPATQYITRSRELMNGHKWDLFVLDLSFILWTILGFITFGLAFIWIIPYQLLTRVEFYKNVKEKSEELEMDELAE